MIEAETMARPKKPKRAPHTPTAPTWWDKGASGPANRERQVSEPATDINPETGKETPNPNRVHRYRRRLWVEVYARQGRITADQLAIAKVLRSAAEGIRERDPLAALGEPRIPSRGDGLISLIDRRALFRAMRARIPRASWPVVERVVLDDRPIWHGNPEQRERHMQRLRDGLEAIC